MTQLLKAVNIGKSYGGTPAMEDVTLSINQGEVICILGATGAGKTTLLRCLNLLEPIDRGVIDYGGHRVIEGVVKRTGPPWNRRNYRLRVNPNRYRRNFGVVHQSDSLYPSRNVLDNVMEGPIYVLRQKRSLVQQIAVELLRAVRMDDRLRAFPCDLTREQRQRVALARAIAMKPDILLLDEMTRGLDPRHIAGLLEIIRELREFHNAAMVITTNHVRFAGKIAHNICYMEGGRIVQKGTPDATLAEPRPQFKAFLKSVVATA